jgi:hypothetical protein
VREETINVKAWHYKSPRIQNNHWMYPVPFTTERWLRLGAIGLDMMARGVYRCEEIITGITGVEEIARAVDTMLHHPDQIVKAVIGPKAGGVE